ncbi:MAG: YceI family protein [Sediminibacterium sp.]|nr:YceI family protein [Sediminibacterium sp.]
MKRSIIQKIALYSALLLTTGLSTVAIGQTSYQSGQVDIRLNGTSNIHDWEMKAVKGSSAASFVIDAKNKLTAVNSLTFTLPARSLKSEHTAMDNNTYKALKSVENPNLSFTLASATVESTGTNSYQLNCFGKLTIAGATKEITLVAIAKYNPADRSLTITGVKKMKMTDYNVKPPKAMLGAIKTGDDISISYTMIYNR